jgi:hypothetical protein
LLLFEPLVLEPFADGVPNAATQQVNDLVLKDEFGAKDYRNDLTLRQDFATRPIWVVSKAKNPCL